MSAITDLLVATLVDLLVEVFKASPAIEVVPKVVEAFDFLLGRVEFSKLRHRLLPAETGFPLKHRRELLEEERLGILGVLELTSSGCLGLEVFIVGVDGIELAATFGISEDLHRLLNAFEEAIVVGISDGTSFFVGMVLQHLLPVYRQQSDQLEKRGGLRACVRAIFICSSVALYRRCDNPRTA